MAITINHQTNDISATGSGSVTIDGATPGGGGGGVSLQTTENLANGDFFRLEQLTQRQPLEIWLY